jgi:thiamine-monophosphate kinase
VGARRAAARLPAPRAPAARRCGADPVALAAGGGEDYELVFAVPPRRAAALPGIARAAGVAVTHIGAVVKGRGVDLRDAHGATYSVGRAGHDHLAHTARRRLELPQRRA